MNKTLLLMFLGYLLLINAIGFTLMLVDKYKAKNNLWRIPESTLFLASVLGGSVGILLGMYTIRHKTKHLTFVLGIPAILIAQMGLFIWLSFRF